VCVVYGLLRGIVGSRVDVPLGGFDDKKCGWERTEIPKIRTPRRRLARRSRRSVANRPDLLQDIRRRRHSPLICPAARFWSLLTDAAVPPPPSNARLTQRAEPSRTAQIVHFYSRVLASNSRLYSEHHWLVTLVKNSTNNKPSTEITDLCMDLYFV